MAARAAIGASDHESTTAAAGDQLLDSAQAWAESEATINVTVPRAAA